jgi:hypothetical protein
MWCPFLWSAAIRPPDQVFTAMSTLTHQEPRHRPKLAFIFAGMATLSVIATISLLVAAVVIH